MKQDDFETPPNTTYLAGMSLGCLPRHARHIATQELDVWSTHAVDGHSPSLHPHHRSWYHRLESLCNDKLLGLVGAEPGEVAVMGELSANLNMLFMQFYKPTRQKFKIVMERGPFPSDQFLVEGHVERCGFDPKEAIVYVEPESDGIIDDQKIVNICESDRSIAMVFLGAINYYTGQLFNLHKIAECATNNNIVCGLDLAHAIGNVPLALHDWNVDFAAWCTYKYLNSGPGGIAGIFVHRRHHQVVPVFRGWWGSERQFGDRFVPLPGAARFVQSNPSALCLSTLLGSLMVFEGTTVEAIRQESFRMCNLFRQLTADLIDSGKLTILTPPEKERSGAQLTLQFPKHDHHVVFERLRQSRIVTDTRHTCIRVAFVALYNDDADVRRLSSVLFDILA